MRLSARSQTIVAGLFVAAIIVLATGNLGAADPPNAKDMTLGSWTLDVSKSKYCGPNTPKGGGRVITDAGWGMIAVVQKGFDQKGQPTESRYVLRYDGQKYPSTIDRPANESITWKQIDPRRVEFTHWSKEDKATAEYVRTVSADGQTMTQTVKRPGQECVESQVYNRQ